MYWKKNCLQRTGKQHPGIRWEMESFYSQSQDVGAIHESPCRDGASVQPGCRTLQLSLACLKKKPGSSDPICNSKTPAGNTATCQICFDNHP